MTKKYYRYKDSHRRVNGVKQKRCRLCGMWKPESDFHKDRARTDGLKSRCKPCDTKCQRELRRKKNKFTREYLRFEERHRTFRGVRQKLCGGCKRWKNETQFYRSRGARDGLGARCKECEGRKNKGAKRYLRFEDRHRVVKGVKQKLCSKCRRWKAESAFYKNRSAKDGLTGRCKKCSYADLKRDL